MGSKKIGRPVVFPSLTGDPSRDRIINLRQRLGISQRELANRLGLTEGTVRGWETGRRQPTGSTLVLIAQLEREP
jgi:putative transcriptional regulator